MRTRGSPSTAEVCVEPPESPSGQRAPPLPSACQREEEGGEMGALCLAPKRCCLSPEIPFPGFAAGQGRAGGWREKSQDQDVSIAAPRAQHGRGLLQGCGDRPLLCPGKGLRSGPDPWWLHRPLFHGFCSRMGFSLPLQPAPVCPNSKTGAKCLLGYSHVAGRKLCWEGLLPSPDSSRFPFICCRARRWDG